MKVKNFHLESSTSRISIANIWKQLFLILSSSASSPILRGVSPTYSFPTTFCVKTTFRSKFTTSSSDPCVSFIAFQNNQQSLLKSSNFQLRKIRHLSTATTMVSPNEESSSTILDYDESIEGYLNCIQDELNYPLKLTSEEEEESSWIVQDKNDEYHFQVKVRPPNRKPMIRALLGIPTKVEMNQIIRTTKQELEYQLMKNYVEQNLLPNLTKEEQEKFKTDSILSMTKKSKSIFQKLATGPVYRGNLQHFIQDKAPDTISLYIKANRSVSETEIFHFIIQERLDNISVKKNENSDKNDLLFLEKRYNTALMCLKMFQSNNNNDNSVEEDQGDDQNDQYSPAAKISGIECEQACVYFLNQKQERNDKDTTSSQTEKRRIVLSNIYVNNVSTSARPKYHPNNLQYQRYNTSSNNKYRRQGVNGDINEMFSSGIIWTHKRRNRKCSELDAIVIELDIDDDENDIFADMNACNVNGSLDAADMDTKEIHIKGRIVEFWEAKSCLNPSTLYDALTKKLSAIQSILEDEDASLTFGRYRMKLQQHSSPVYPIKFGMYAMELLPPINAIGQLKSMAMAHALDTNIDAIFQAVEKGYVHIPVGEIQHDLKKLQKTFHSIPNNFEFVMEINK